MAAASRSSRQVASPASETSKRNSATVIEVEATRLPADKKGTAVRGDIKNSDYVDEVRPLRFDSSLGKQRLPKEWTMVAEVNMEGRVANTGWHSSMERTVAYLRRQLKKSLLETPHPLLSAAALGEMDKMRGKIERSNVD